MIALSQKPRVRRPAVIIATVLLLILGTSAWLFHSKTSLNPQSTALASSHVELIVKLNALESGLQRGLTPGEMVEFASEIRDEITIRPLPAEDEFQFGADLLMRELRTLAALQNHHDLKGAKVGSNQLNASSSESKGELEANERKCQAIISQQLTNLKKRLSKAGTAGAQPTPLSE